MKSQNIGHLNNLDNCSKKKNGMQSGIAKELFFFESILTKIYFLKKGINENELLKN